ncbi:MAG TPA: histidine kinase N-terminal 7TM domain-containing protein [Anaerolineales bacterium]|nr:histidine kinase N-terminal 7TM domain-containing protein [Anaerolineales bacterium]
MQAPFHINAVFLLISATLTLVAAVIAGGRRVPGSFALSLLLLSMSIWSGFYALTWLSLPLPLKMFLPNITYIGVATVPTLFLVFALSFTQREEWLTRRRLFLLGVQPGITLLLVWTNRYHQLVFEQTALLGQDGFVLLQMERGPWYTVNMFYSYLAIIAGLLLLLNGMWHSSPLMKNEYRLVLIAALIPALVNMYYETYGSAGHVDLAPLSFGMSGILFTYSVVRNRFMDIIPVARTRLIERMSDGILVLDRQNRVVDCNPAMEIFLSRKPASLLARPAVEILQPWMEKVEALINGQETHVVLRIHSSPPRYLDLNVTPLYDDRRHLSGRLMVFHDITDHKNVEKKLRYANDRLQSQLIEIGTLQSKLRAQAIHDPLTDLFNRRYLDETLDRELARAAREGYPLCVIMLDIDHFKRMNDAYGHEAGDLVLKALARTLLASNRRGDFACRFGGEEFVVVMPNITMDTAFRRAGELRTTLNSLIVPYDGYNLMITISMGIACYPASGKDRESLLRAADRAMYAAKKAGRDYIQIYDHLDTHRGIVS